MKLEEKIHDALNSYPDPAMPVDENLISDALEDAIDFLQAAAGELALLRCAVEEIDADVVGMAEYQRDYRLAVSQAAVSRREGYHDGFETAIRRVHDVACDHFLAGDDEVASILRDLYRTIEDAYEENP